MCFSEASPKNCESQVMYMWWMLTLSGSIVYFVILISISMVCISATFLMPNGEHYVNDILLEVMMNLDVLHTNQSFALLWDQVMAL